MDVERLCLELQDVDPHEQSLKVGNEVTRGNQKGTITAIEPAPPASGKSMFWVTITWTGEIQ